MINYKGIQPVFQPLVLQILQQLEDKGYQPIIAEGLRTQAQEAEKVKEGNSQTMHSYHLTGLAVDIVDKRYLWNIPVVHQFWWDLYKIASSLAVRNGHLRYGIIWDHPEREALYKQALDASHKTVPWFADVAHIELHPDSL